MENSEFIGFRLLPQQKKKALKNAKALGLSLSEYTRLLYSFEIKIKHTDLNSDVFPTHDNQTFPLVTLEEIKLLQKTLVPIGTNINQGIKALNYLSKRLNFDDEEMQAFQMRDLVAGTKARLEYMAENHIRMCNCCDEICSYVKNWMW